MKNFRFSDNISLQMRAETFNVFNHTNFAGIDNGLSDGAFSLSHKHARAAHHAIQRKDVLLTAEWLTLEGPGRRRLPVPFYISVASSFWPILQALDGSLEITSNTASSADLFRLLGDFRFLSFASALFPINVVRTTQGTMYRSHRSGLKHGRGLQSHVRASVVAARFRIDDTKIELREPPGLDVP